MKFYGVVLVDFYKTVFRALCHGGNAKRGKGVFR